MTRPIAPVGKVTLFVDAGHGVEVDADFIVGWPFEDGDAVTRADFRIMSDAWHKKQEDLT